MMKRNNGECVTLTQSRYLNVNINDVAQNNGDCINVNTVSIRFILFPCFPILTSSLY